MVVGDTCRRGLVLHYVGYLDLIESDGLFRDDVT